MLLPRFSSHAFVKKTSTGWRLEVPAGEAGSYRLAQVDDYTRLPRRYFPYSPPLHLNLRCRTSGGSLPGTWGFGLWNDPFSLSLGTQGAAHRLPALPNACWFFHASAENHLTFRDGLPGSGFLAQSFRSPKIPTALLAPGVLGLPLLSWRIISAWLRRLAGKIIQQDSRILAVDVMEWHTYTLSWQGERVTFSVDGATVLETPISPRAALGLVIWIDNQYAAWRPSGEVGFGTLKNESCWLEIEQVNIGR